jgi:FtsZ-interacting cell division protein YlmF
MFSNLISNFASYFAQGENDVEELETEEEYEELDEFEEEYEETEEFSSKEEEEVTTSSRQNQSEEKSLIKSNHTNCTKKICTLAKCALHITK